MKTEIGISTAKTQALDGDNDYYSCQKQVANTSMEALDEPLDLKKEDYDLKSF